MAEVEASPAVRPITWGRVAGRYAKFAPVVALLYEALSPNYDMTALIVAAPLLQEEFFSFLARWLGSSIGVFIFGFGLGALWGGVERLVRQKNVAAVSYAASTTILIIIAGLILLGQYGDSFQTSN